MYNTNFSAALSNQKIFETGNRIIETFTLFIKSALHKKKEDNEALSYFFHLTKKGSTVIDIGTYNNKDYVYFLLKMAKRSVRMISFQSEPEVCSYLSQKKEILNLQNVCIEQLALSKETRKASPAFSLRKKNGVTVIDFRTKKNQYVNETVALDMLDKYCKVYDIHPDIIRISGKGNELIILNSAAEILRKYKPAILLECQERYAGRENILQTFKFLTDLKYSGYFILDTMKIPVVNFDFNIYQNPLSNFYCKDFIFK